MIAVLVIHAARHHDYESGPIVSSPHPARYHKDS
jgi:hypothetical protein